MELCFLKKFKFTPKFEFNFNFKLWAITILITLGLGIVYQIYIFQYYNLVSPSLAYQSMPVLEIKPGMSFRTITKTLYQIPNVHKAPGFMFETLVRFHKKSHLLKAGEYGLDPGITPQQLLAKIVKGEVRQYAFTIIEGWTISDLLNKLNENPYIISDIKNKLLSNNSENINFNTALEGLCLPDTYYFAKGTTHAQFVNRAMQALQQHLTHEWNNRDPKITLKTPYEALILASIIEKETAVDLERTKISSVFHERLKLNMPLQADPTVIYGARSIYSGKITSAMLRQDTPYNTYLRKGLPPTPIALPGLASIRAALHPEAMPQAQPYLYFVAKGDGSHYFSKTIEEHNQAVRKYIIEKPSQ